VVIYHAMISSPRFGHIRLEPGEQDLSSLEFAITCTPLRIFWAGSEAVVVFFVLSGFVLALPFARRGGIPSRYFYPRRMLRLYLPAIASLIFAFLTALLVPRVVIPGASPWLNEHALVGNGPLQVILGSSLMYGWGGLNISLWSLRWEVLFSLLLAVFLWIARTWPQLLWFKVAAVVIVCSVWPIAGLFYANGIFIAVFMLGVLMAFNVDRMEGFARRIPTAGWWLLLAGSAVLLTYAGLVVGAHPDPLLPIMSMWIGPAAAGATLLVFAAAHWGPFVRVLQLPAVRWLGTISFSLYLVQDPIVVTLALVTGGFMPLPLLIPLAVGAALSVAWLFYLLVEKQSHRLSRNFLKQRELRQAELADVRD
jgi:peptidoglycan/LPS O-acetylase OafA/YrhL